MRCIGCGNETIASWTKLQMGSLCLTCSDFTYDSVTLLRESKWLTGSCDHEWDEDDRCLECGVTKEPDDDYCEKCDLIGDHFEDCGKDDEPEAAPTKTLAEKYAKGTEFRGAYYPVPFTFAGLAGPNPPQAVTLAYLNDDCTCPTLLNGHHAECPRGK